MFQINFNERSNAMFSIAGQTVQCPDGLNMSCDCIISLSIRQWDNVILTLLSTFINDLLANEISDVSLVNIKSLMYASYE